MKVFNNSDWVMKFLSVAFGGFSVILGYFCGKYFDIIHNIKENPGKTGIIFSGLLAVNSLTIYYAQEARPYSLLILLSTFLIFAVLKLVNEFNTKNIILFTLANLFLLHTHTLAYPFCLFELLALFIYFYKSNKTYLKKYVISCVILGILCAPTVYDMLQNLLGLKSKSWDDLSLTSIFSFINNFFSPFMFNLQNHLLTLEKLFSSPFTTLLFLVFSLPLIIINFAGILKTLKTSPLSRHLLAACVLFICFVCFLNPQDRITFISRYVITTLPFFLLFASYGLTLFKSKFINTKSLIITVLLLNLVFMSVFYRHNAQHLPKKIFPTNFNDLSKTLNKYSFQPEDTFIIIYYGSTGRFIHAPKYYDFSPCRVHSLDSCVWGGKNIKKCVKSRREQLKEILAGIKESTAEGRLIITIPSRFFRLYEKTINQAPPESSFNSYKKLDENGWVTLIYSN